MSETERTLEGIQRALLLQEARSSIALDKDPRYQTFSVDSIPEPTPEEE